MPSVQQAAEGRGDRPRRAALVFVLVTVALDMLAMGTVLPVLPHLIEVFVGGDVPRAAVLIGLFGTAWALMQFVFSPLLGVLSDRFGRRPVILLSNVGLGLDCVLMALAPSLGWLFVGRLVSGVTAAIIPTATAYIADVTPPERRAAAFGLLGAAFGGGFILGPAMGGLLGGIDPRLPFWVAAALSLANAAYGWLVLPESLPPGRRARFSWRRANPIGALSFLRAKAGTGLIGLSLVNMLGYLAHEVLTSVFVLYATHRYGWNQTAIGLTLAVVGVAVMVVQGGLVGPAVRRLGERRTLMLGLVCGAIGFALFGLAPTGVWFLAGIPLLSLWGLAGPATQGLMSRHVADHEQGLLQGGQSSLRGITAMAGPVLFSNVYAVSLAAAWDVGLAFYAAALLVAGSVLLAWRVVR